MTRTKGWKRSDRRAAAKVGGPKLVTRRAKDNPLAKMPEEVKAQISPKLVPAKSDPVTPVGRNTTPVPRDRRVPVVEIDDLLVKTINVLGDSDVPRIEISRRGGAAPSTLRNWEQHKVRRPLVSTLKATLKACGYRLAIIDPTGKEL